MKIWFAGVPGGNVIERERFRTVMGCQTMVILLLGGEIGTSI